jgi:hypothetical protein
MAKLEVRPIKIRGAFPKIEVLGKPRINDIVPKDAALGNGDPVILSNSQFNYSRNGKGPVESFRGPAG